MTSPDLGTNNGGGGLGASDVGATGARGGEAGRSRGEVEAPGSGDRMDDGDGVSTGRRTEERASLGGRAGAGRGCRREIGRGRRRRVLAAGGDRIEARWKEGPAWDLGSRGRRPRIERKGSRGDRGHGSRTARPCGALLAALGGTKKEEGFEGRCGSRLG
ncbi:hypothetical protein VPH35_002213 [Triticum aestivum]